jgi:hypothetical protein
MFMNYIKVLQQNTVFRWFSSVKLAVPLLLIIAVTVAAGTLIESHFNATYAKLLVYGTWWFNLLLLVLGVVIFLATISRLPWKKRHIGFLVTHLGMLTLLTGSVITKYYGVDGQLRIEEGKQENQIVIYNENVLEVAGPRIYKKFDIARLSSKKEASYFSAINSQLESQLQVQKYYPFVNAEPLFQGMTSPKGYFVKYRIKSKFFDQEDWLSTESKSDAQMGPALFRVIAGEYTPSKSKKNKASKSSAPSVVKSVKAQKIETHSGDETPTKSPDRQAQSEAQQTSEAPKNSEASAVAPTLIVHNASKTKDLKKILMRDALKAPFKVNGATIYVKAAYSSASVSNNKIVEGGGGALNPALEIEITKDGKTYRDVVYAKFPEFSMQKDDSLGLRFTYIYTGMKGEAGVVAAHGTKSSNPHEGQNMDTTSANDNMTDSGMADNTKSADTAPAAEVPAGTPPPMFTGGKPSNLVEIYIDPKNPQVGRLVLFKNDQEVLNSPIKLNEVIQTPWMGMTFTVSELGFKDKNAPEEQTVQTVEEVEPTPKTDSLPSSALLIQPTGTALPFVLAEGMVKEFVVGGENYQIYYGPNSIRLPFTLELEKFHKKDYPGTEMARSFESDVRVLQDGSRTTISMNEPLKKGGFTLYQSSFEMRPGITPASIFSVNRDPGRWIKYLGSIIMSLGIITYTLMRSRFYKTKQGAL